MKNQEYIVKKYNEQGCNYDNLYFDNYREAWAHTNKRDVMLVCKPGSVYHGDNFQGWTVEPNDIIRAVTR